MGNSLYYLQLIDSSKREWVSGVIRFRESFAVFELMEDDDNPKDFVVMTLRANLGAQTTGAETGVSSANNTTATLTGDYSGTVTTLTGVTVNHTYKNLSKTITVATIRREETERTVALTLKLTNGGGADKTRNFHVTIPPLKQNATNSGKRITCTVDGVKYDLLNYK